MGNVIETDYLLYSTFYGNLGIGQSKTTEDSTFLQSKYYPVSPFFALSTVSSHHCQWAGCPVQLQADGSSLPMGCQSQPSKGAEAQKINHTLDKIKAKIIEHYQKIREREGFASAEMVRNAYQGIGNEYETLLSAFDKHNADFSKRVGKDRAKGTYDKYRIVRNHLANFIGSYYKRKDISMKELSEEFIRQFDIYLRTEVCLSSSGVWMYTTPLKMIVTRAHCDGHLHRNPFAQYHASPNVRERQFLTEEELHTMINHPFTDPSFAKMRDIFVFGCLTGISFIDIKNLTTDNLVDINGSYWIVSKRKKTNIQFRVMLLDGALKIIERYKPFRKDNYLFDFLGNQQANRKLKRIAKACGIDKSVCFHMSRHTFSTLALSKGMPIESVSKILGHTKITTTQIYAKITTEKLENDISAFGKKLEAGLASLSPTNTNSSVGSKIENLQVGLKN